MLLLLLLFRLSGRFKANIFSNLHLNNSLLTFERTFMEHDDNDYIPTVSVSSLQANISSNNYSQGNLSNPNLSAINIYLSKLYFKALSLSSSSSSCCDEQVFYYPDRLLENPSLFRRYRTSFTLLLFLTLLAVAFRAALIIIGWLCCVERSKGSQFSSLPF